MEKEHLRLHDNQCRKSTKGFTLLESLIALLLLSLICLLFFSVLRNAKSTIGQLETSEEKSWHIFLIQLENELENGQFEAVLPNKIILKTKQNNHSLRIESKLGKIVKVENGGYQPMLTKVKEANFENKIDSIEMTILFENNQKFTGSWLITKEHLNE